MSEEEAFSRKVREAPGMTNRRILVNTSRAELVLALASHVGGDADVVQCWSLTSLIQALREGVPSVIVVDCGSPGAKPLSIAALAEGFPATANAVVLCTDAVQTSQLVRFAPSVFRWPAYTGSTDLKPVAERCMELLAGVPLSR